MELLLGAIGLLVVVALVAATRRPQQYYVVMPIEPVAPAGAGCGVWLLIALAIWLLLSLKT